ncbi:MAG: hypothetical protein HYX42_06090 [Polaromonas sp.]|uniref:hypothetical protein n=1 Tax=Polaromonas sp. TaxID=1869339 RepID=UPI0025F113AA|nr:hypothetical protein [Polaromonas sp.]MBI2725806.1 hypothetical protein [Polaromonas sp.]
MTKPDGNSPHASLRAADPNQPGCRFINAEDSLSECKNELKTAPTSPVYAPATR